MEDLERLAASVDEMVLDGRIDMAETRLQVELRRYPWNGLIPEKLSITAACRGDWKSAKDWMIRALVLAPEAAPRWTFLAHVLRELGCDEEAHIASSIGSTF